MSWLSLRPEPKKGLSWAPTVVMLDQEAVAVRSLAVALC